MWESGTGHTPWVPVVLASPTIPPLPEPGLQGLVPWGSWSPGGDMLVCAFPDPVRSPRAATARCWFSRFDVC